MHPALLLWRLPRTLAPAQAAELTTEFVARRWITDPEGSSPFELGSEVGAIWIRLEDPSEAAHAEELLRSKLSALVVRSFPAGSLVELTTDDQLAWVAPPFPRTTRLDTKGLDEAKETGVGGGFGVVLEFERPLAGDEILVAESIFETWLDAYQWCSADGSDIRGFVNGARDELSATSEQWFCDPFEAPNTSEQFFSHLLALLELAGAVLPLKCVDFSPKAEEGGHELHFHLGPDGVEVTRPLLGRVPTYLPMWIATAVVLAMRFVPRELWWYGVLYGLLVPAFMWRSWHYVKGERWGKVLALLSVLGCLLEVTLAIPLAQHGRNPSLEGAAWVETWGAWVLPIVVATSGVLIAWGYAFNRVGEKLCERVSEGLDGGLLDSLKGR